MHTHADLRNSPHWDGEFELARGTRVLFHDRMRHLEELGTVTEYVMANLRWGLDVRADSTGEVVHLNPHISWVVLLGRWTDHGYQWPAVV